MITFDEIKNAVLNNPRGNVLLVDGGISTPIVGAIMPHATGEILAVKLDKTNIKITETATLQILPN